MIWESYYWKSDLLKHAAALRKRKEQKRWVDASYGRTEQTVMLGFYSIRKLIEARKLRDDVAHQIVEISAHAPTGKRITRLNSHRIDELYDLDRRRSESCRLEWLCNQIIHSYIFALLTEEHGGLAGVLVTSDRNRSKALYEVTVDQMIVLFDQIGNDYPTDVSMKFDPDLGDYKVHSGNAAQPSDPE